MRSPTVVKVPFLGCALTMGAGVVPVLDVSCHNGYLRGPDGTCAFCQDDPMAQRGCSRCGGGRINIIRANDYPMESLPVRSFPGSRWSFQHVPHAARCKVVTWIDREFAAHPDHVPFKACPCCLGRPT
jgi:hypothetical protein